MINKGTHEGTIAEKDFVTYYNKNKDSNNQVWKLILDNLDLNKDLDNYHILRVTSHVYSALSGKKVLPKADAYLVEGTIPTNELLNLDYELDEKNTKKYNLEPIAYSGISIKRPDSKRFQILKMVPDSFNKLIGNYVLGAGSSIYCRNESDLTKNDSVLNGWNTTWDEIINFFSYIEDIDLINNNDLSDGNKLSILKKIKSDSNKKIKNIILKDEDILYIAFKGTEIFEEPYPAYYIYMNSIFELNKPFDFKVTTGSGRSRGDFTIVLKP